MNVLGITHPISQNTAAALIVDGKLIAAAEEERFTRVKHAPNAIPENAVKFVLKKAGLKPEDIDIVATTHETVTTEANLLVHSFKGMMNNQFRRSEFYHWIEAGNKERRLQYYLKDNFKNAKFRRVSHHLSHASSACFFSGFKKSLFMTLDGRGEFESGLLGIYEDGKYDVIRSIKLKESMGTLYSYFTSAIGFKQNTDEGKTMGLAPYGKPLDALRNAVTVTPKGEIKINWNIVRNANRGPYRGTDPTQDIRKDIAASAQLILEETALKLVDVLKERSGYKNICLAGGVALNIDMNTRILYEGGFDDIYVQPASHDAGCALGAAAYAYHEATGKMPVTTMDHAYWGADYTDEEIKATLDSFKIKKYQKLDNPAPIVADLIAKDRIVAWFQGRFEFGPRALGARSMLSNPTKKEMWDIVNRVKGREYWRPLAPSVLEEKADKLFERYHRSPFMLMSFKVKPDKIPFVPAIVHVDNTARPQAVSKNTNKVYWEMIREFEKISGAPTVINTSLNLRGEPIVNSPGDCVRTFFASGIDHAVIGNYLINKN